MAGPPAAGPVHDGRGQAWVGEGGEQDDRFRGVDPGSAGEVRDGRGGQAGCAGRVEVFQSPDLGESPLGDSEASISASLLRVLRAPCLGAVDGGLAVGSELVSGARGTDARV